MLADPRRTALLAGVAVLSLSLVAAGCSGMRRAVGAEKIAPDEFRVLTKAPLSVPPEYNLRPPRPGEPRPQDLAPADLAASALYGGAGAESASDAEQLLLARAGAARAEPAIRAVVDAEGGGVVRKGRGFSNRILFWRGDDSADEAEPAQSASTEELARRDQLAEAATGGDAVVIRRDVGPKLPGL